MSFEKKTLANGEANPKYIDLCDEDQPIAGQRFVCMSFVSPEKVLKKRETFLFDQFVKQWDLNKSLERFHEFVHFIGYKYNIKADELVADLNDFVKDEEKKLKETTVEDDYKTFLDKNEDRLNDQFNKENAFQTSVRGVKVRGTFSSQEEAEMNAKKIRERDPHHDIFVGPVGMWMPWDPDSYKTQRTEFLEEELNQLHKEKIANDQKAKAEFENRIRETKRKAIEENIELAKKSGNVLTQTMNEAGDLIGVKETVDFDSREVSDSVSTNLRNEMLLAGEPTVPPAPPSLNVEL